MFTFECAKFRGSQTIVGLVGLVLSCHCAVVGVSRIKNIFFGVFRRSQFFSSVSRGFQMYSGGYFVGPKFFLVGIFWVRNFSRGYFVG